MNTMSKIFIIIYSLFLVVTVLNLIFFPGIIPFENPVSYGFIAVGVLCTVVLCTRIEAMKYSPVILIAVFLTGGRTLAFAADFLFENITNAPLYRLPFGSIDYFLFNLLAPALLKRLRKDHPSKMTPLMFIPMVVLALPLFAHIIPDGLTPLSVYSVFYCLTAAASAAAAIYYIKTRPERKFIGFCILAGILVELCIYLNMFFSNFILPEINLILFPYIMIIMTGSILTIKLEESDD